MPFHRREVADAPPGVHLPDETIPDARHELGAPLVLPLLERHRARHVEPLEERPPDLHVGRVEPPQVRIHRFVGERDGRPLHLQVLAADLLLDDRQCLSERMPRQMRWRVGPQQVHQIVARELLPRLGCESDQEREMLARAEADLLPRLGQQ